MPPTCQPLCHKSQLLISQRGYKESKLCLTGREGAVTINQIGFHVSAQTKTCTVYVFLLFRLYVPQNHITCKNMMLKRIHYFWAKTYISSFGHFGSFGRSVQLPCNVLLRYTLVRETKQCKVVGQNNIKTKRNKWSKL